MPHLAVVIAKVLALADYFLGSWVSADPVLVEIVEPGECRYGIAVVNAGASECGAQFLDQVTGIVSQSVSLAYHLILGVFAA